MGVRRNDHEYSRDSVMIASFPLEGDKDYAESASINALPVEAILKLLGIIRNSA